MNEPAAEDRRASDAASSCCFSSPTSSISSTGTSSASWQCRSGPSSASTTRRCGTLGVAFGIFYAIIAIPIAWLADRKSRVNIIAAAVALWSLFTAACGMVQTYTQLVVARMGVAVGEAGGIAPSYSLISDYLSARAPRPGAGLLSASASRSARRSASSSAAGWPRIWTGGPRSSSSACSACRRRC